MDVRAARLAPVDHGQEVGGLASNPQQDAGGGPRARTAGANTTNRGTRRVTANRGRRWLRWAVGAGSGVMVIAGALSLATESGAGATVAPGQGSSYAQSLQVTPHEGSLAVGVVLGEALAGHTNFTARAQSQGVDLGAIGTALTGYNCGSPPTLQPNQIPQPLQAESGQPGAASGMTQTPTSPGLDLNAKTPPPAFGSTEFVQATGSPYAEADTSFAPVDTPLLSIAGMKAKSWSGLVGGVREAGATSDVGSLSFLGGVVQLSGLHWETVYPSGGTAKPTGSFTLGRLVVQGLAVPLPADTSLLVSTVNQALGLFGIQIVAPVVSNQQGIETVTPLQIEVVPNTARDTLIDGLLNGAAPLTNQLFNGLETGFTPAEPSSLVALLCQSDTPITVADVTLASIDGGGFFTEALGGVHAASSAVAANQFTLGFGTLGARPGTSQFVPGAQGLASTPGTPGTPAVAGTSGVSQPVSSGQPALAGSSTQPTATPTSSTTPSGAARVQTAAAVGHGAGGPLLGIGLGGLGLLALLAEGDRRMMRRAQHTVNFEE